MALIRISVLGSAADLRLCVSHMQKCFVITRLILRLFNLDTSSGVGLVNGILQRKAWLIVSFLNDMPCFFQVLPFTDNQQRDGFGVPRPLNHF